MIKSKALPASLLAVGCAWALHTVAAPAYKEVVVIATRVAQSGFDLPVSADLIDQNAIQNGP